MIWGALVVMVVMAGLTVWLFFFNRGKVEFVGEGNFRVQVLGVGAWDCGERECLVEISPGEYSFLISKQGYEDQNISLNVRGGETLREEVGFVFVPKVVEIGEWNASELETRYGSLFGGWEEGDLKKNLDLIKGKVEGDLFDWNNGQFVFVADDEEVEGQYLYKMGGKAERIVQFSRPLVKGLVAVNLDGSKVAAVDTTYETDNIYVIDVTSQSRKRLGKSLAIARIKWLGDDILFEGRNGKLFLVAVDNEEVKEFGVEADFANVDVGEEGEVFFLAGRGEPGDGYYINKYNSVNGEITPVVHVTEGVEGIVEKLEVSSDKKKIRLLSEGKIYEIQLSL